MNAKTIGLITTLLVTAPALAQQPKSIQQQVNELQQQVNRLEAQMNLIREQLSNLANSNKAPNPLLQGQAKTPNPLLNPATPHAINQPIIVTVTSNTAADVSGLQEKLDNQRINHDTIVQNLEDARDRQVDVSTKVRTWTDDGESEMEHRHDSSVRNRVDRQVKKLEADKRRSKGIINRLEREIERAKKNRIVMGTDPNGHPVHITAKGINAQVAQTMMIGTQYQVSGHQTTAGGVIRITMSSAVPIN